MWLLPFSEHRTGITTGKCPSLSQEGSRDTLWQKRHTSFSAEAQKVRPANVIPCEFARTQLFWSTRVPIRTGRTSKTTWMVHSRRCLGAVSGQWRSTTQMTNSTSRLYQEELKPLVEKTSTIYKLIRRVTRHVQHSHGPSSCWKTQVLNLSMKQPWCSTTLNPERTRSSFKCWVMGTVVAAQRNRTTPRQNRCFRKSSNKWQSNHRHMCTKL